MLFPTALIAFLFVGAQATTEPPPGELPPVYPYTQSDENAGADPITNASVFEAFHGEEGISRIVEDFVDGITTDPRIEGIFRARDDVRFRRTLKEQFCYVLGGPCTYSGMDMAMAHKDHGVTTAEFNALVENLQTAMDKEGVPFRMQNKLLAKLAPMKHDVVTR